MIAIHAHFSETFLWQNMLTSLKWRVKLQDPIILNGENTTTFPSAIPGNSTITGPSFWMVKIHNVSEFSISFPRSFFTQPMALTKFTRCYPFLLHSVWSDAPELLSCRTALFLFLGTTDWSGLGKKKTWPWNLDKSETFYRVRICDIFRTPAEKTSWDVNLNPCFRVMYPVHVVAGKTSPRLRKHSVKCWSRRSQPGPRAYPFLIHLVAISHQYCGELTALYRNE